MQTVAAFFDLDGTLLPAPSLEKRFFPILRQQKAIRIGNCFAWLREATRLMPRGINHVLYGNKVYLRGVRVSEVDSLTTPPFFPQALERVLWHAERGHDIALVSGTPEPLAQMAAATLESALAQRGICTSLEVFATRLETAAGSWTGRIVGEAMFGEAKARAVRRFAAARGIDPSNCFAYGDSANDRWMLEAVGKPVAANPSDDLKRIAARNRWDIVRWNEEKPRTQTQNARRSQDAEQTVHDPQTSSQRNGFEEMRIAAEIGREAPLARMSSEFKA